MNSLKFFFNNLFISLASVKALAGIDSLENELTFMEEEVQNKINLLNKHIKKNTSTFDTIKVLNMPIQPWNYLN